MQSMPYSEIDVSMKLSTPAIFVHWKKKKKKKKKSTTRAVTKCALLLANGRDIRFGVSMISLETKFCIPLPSDMVGWYTISPWHSINTHRRWKLSQTLFRLCSIAKKTFASKLEKYEEADSSCFHTCCFHIPPPLSPLEQPMSHAAANLTSYPLKIPSKSSFSN